MTTKHKVIRIVLSVEIIAVIIFLLFGAQGFIAVRALKQSVKKMEQENNARMQEIKNLEDEYAAWQNDPFYIEKYAREKLAMSRDDETMYVMK